MRLTNTIRDAFVRSAMNDLPKVDYSEEAKKIILEAAIQSLPLRIREIWGDPALKEYVPQCFLAGGWHNSGIMKEISSVVPSIQVPGLQNRISFSETQTQALKAIAANHLAQTKKQSELQIKLRAIAYSVNTRKALSELLPEFTKYLPAEITEPSKNLPAVVNVVQEFMDAGWPKNKNKNT